MAKALNHIESEALKLPTRSRAQLAEKLIYSLEKKGSSKNEQLWARESLKRYEALASGKTQGKPALKVLRDIRSKIK
jgi:hypothetical protein